MDLCLRTSYCFFINFLRFALILLIWRLNLNVLDLHDSNALGELASCVCGHQKVHICIDLVQS